MRKEPNFLSQFRYSKRIETIFNAKRYAFDDAFAHITQLRENTRAFRVQSIKSDGFATYYATSITFSRNTLNTLNTLRSAEYTSWNTSWGRL